MPRKTTPKRKPARPAKPVRKDSSRTPAPIADAQPIAGALQMIDAQLLERWDANPRRVRDEAKLDQLARSIAADGVLQNLVVRPHPKRKDHYQVITGNRRHAAHAIARSEYNPALPPELPCRVATLSDLEAQRLATVENVQRADMHPMDEAEAFARMLELGDVTENVAALTGFSVATVRKRIALATLLAASVKTAFREGKLNLACAQAFTIGSKDQQTKLLKRQRFDHDDADWIRRQLAEACVPVSYALFDVAAYEENGGRIVRDLFAGADDVDAYFEDAARFRTAQARAIKQKIEHLKAAGWAWVEHKRGSYVDTFAFGKSKTKKSAGVIVHERDSGEVTIHEGLVKPADQKKAEKTKGKAARGAAGDEADTAEPAKLAGKGLMVACHHAKTRALQLGVAAAHEGPALRVPMACVVMALLRDGGHTYGGSQIKLRSDPPTGDDQVVVPTITARLQDLLAPLADQGLIDRSTLNELLGSASRDEKDEDMEAAEQMAPADLFRALLTYQHLPALFATLVARHVGSWPGYRPELGSTPLACVIAERVTPGVLGEIDGAPSWQLDAEWLKRYDRPGLVRLAKALGIPRGDADRLANYAKASIVDAILKHPSRNPEAIPPELRFLTPAETEAALRDLDAEEAPAAEPVREAAE